MFNANLCQKLQRAKSTVSEIWSTREYLKRIIAEANSGANTKQRKILCTAIDADLDKAVYLWYLQWHVKRAPVSSSLID